MWSRKAFVHELANAERRAEHLDTVFGNLWIVLSPLFMAAIYFLLIFVLQGSHQGSAYFLHLVAGIFLFNFISIAAARGASSITSAGRLIMNTSFPRALLPITATWAALIQFLPTMIVYFIFHIVLRQPFGWAMLSAIPALGLVIVFTAGLSMITATAQVYFRDTKSLLPFVMRIWMYITPVLYLPGKIAELSSLTWLQWANPLFKTFEIWAGSIVRLETFSASTWIVASTWSFGFFILGALLLLSREGEFAVRL
jgi:ABC-type polysaccharide/polyol phosphate export permease